MSHLLLHFDGDIARDHKVSLRTLSKSLSHLQSAVNRAYLDVKYEGGVWKHARLSSADYEKTELWTLPSEEGGYIIKFINDTPVIRNTLSRIVNAITPTLEKSKSDAISAASTLTQQSTLREGQVRQGLIVPKDFSEFVPTANSNPYGDRAINKEIDQVISVVRTPSSGESTIEIEVGGARSSTFLFDRAMSESFHTLVSNRFLGDPLLITAQVIELHSVNKTAQAFNIETQRHFRITFANEKSFAIIKEYLGTPNTMQFFGSPIYEGGAFDPSGGDIFFIGMP